MGGVGEGEKRAQELAQLLPILFAIDSKLQTSSLSLFSRPLAILYTHTLLHSRRKGRGKKIEANKHYGK